MKKADLRAEAAELRVQQLEVALRKGVAATVRAEPAKRRPSAGQAPEAALKDSTKDVAAEGRNVRAEMAERRVEELEAALKDSIQNAAALVTAETAERQVRELEAGHKDSKCDDEVLVRAETAERRVMELEAEASKAKDAEKPKDKLNASITITARACVVCHYSCPLSCPYSRSMPQHWFLKHRWGTWIWTLTMNPYPFFRESFWSGDPEGLFVESASSPVPVSGCFAPSVECHAA